MGIQINGANDTISASDGSLSVAGQQLTDVTNINATGIVTATTYVVGAGSASAPSITPSGDSDTGLYSPGADQLALATGGSGRLFVDSAGAVDVSSANARLYITTTGTNTAIATLRNASYFYNINLDGSTGGLTFYNGSERLRIDSSGRLLVGTSSARSNFYNTTAGAVLQVEGSGGSGDSRRIAVIGSDNTAQSGGGLLLAHQRSGSIGGNTILQSGDDIGVVTFQGNDGTDFVEAAVIEAEVDGTPGADDMPGRLVFSTTADAAATPTERMRIGNAGNILMGTSSAIISGLYTLQVAGGRGAVIKSTGGGSNSSLTLWNNDNVNDCSLIDFRTNTVDTTRGSITYNASTGLIQYNTTSDYRAKTLNGLLQNASDSVASLSVYEGTMNGATQSMPMMVAHEVQEVAPYCVTGEKDATDENGEPVYQQLDYTAMVPLLTAALQEALAKIETLEQRLTDAGL